MVYGVFDSLDKAKKFLAKSTDNMAMKFCPLTSEPCRTNCVAFAPLEIKERNTNEITGTPIRWSVIGGRCNAYALTGPR